MKAGRPKLPLGSRFFSVQLSPEHQAVARKLGGQTTQGIRIALEATMNELERKNKVAALLARSMKLNAELDSLNAERRMISEQIYAIQCEYKKEIK